MSAGVPMYYLTASSRIAGRNNSVERRERSWMGVINGMSRSFRSS